MIEYRAAHDIVSRVVRESPDNSGGGLLLKEFVPRQNGGESDASRTHRALQGYSDGI